MLARGGGELDAALTLRQSGVRARDALYSGLNIAGADASYGSPNKVESDYAETSYLEPGKVMYDFQRRLDHDGG